MFSTEKRRQIYLIGHELKTISGQKLPTARQVISLFFYKHNSLKLTLKNSAVNTIKDVEEIWKRAEIPLSQTQHCVKKLIKLHSEWKSLQKNFHRKNSHAQQIKESLFNSKLNSLFDISHRDALKVIKTEEKRLFLISQQKSSRRGFINKEGKSSEKPNNVTSENSFDLTDIYDELVLSQQSTLSDGLNQLEPTVSNFDDEIQRPIKKHKKNIMTPNLAAALDRSKVSSRNATYIIAAVAEGLGHNIENINLSYKSLHRNRNKARETIAKKLKTDILIKNNLIVHWDGKLLSDLTGFHSVERLPIVISSPNSELLLGVPKLASGTGQNQASAIIETLDEWNLTDRVKAMCFDTTSVNTGRLNGTCAIIEKILQRNLVYLPCRHHIFELILKSVFEVYWPTATGPDVSIFKRFKEAWTKINSLNYKTGMQDIAVSSILKENKNHILSFIEHHLQITQPREDYKELLELSYIFLEDSTRRVSFKYSGAMHHARWMSKAIYCLKIFLFRDQFKLTTREINALRGICIFIINLYIGAWFSAPLAISAPHNDFKLLQNLINYQNINPAISKAACNKFAAHLWYMSEELIALSLFDESISIDIKTKMVEAIKNREGSAINSKRMMIDHKNFASILNKDLSDFFTKKSMVLFERFELPTDFLDLEIKLWPTAKSFVNCLEFFKSMKVVNDIAERGVALIESYNTYLTKNEDQFQYLIQVVQNHRTKYPNCNKKTLKK